jgi:uncharacterized protein with PQ loop repeat
MENKFHMLEVCVLLIFVVPTVKTTIKWRKTRWRNAAWLATLQLAHLCWRLYAYLWHFVHLHGLSVTLASQERSLIVLACGHIVSVPYQIPRTVIRGGFLWDVGGSMIHSPQVMMKLEDFFCHVSSYSKVAHKYGGILTWEFLRCDFCMFACIPGPYYNGVTCFNYWFYYN